MADEEEQPKSYLRHIAPGTDRNSRLTLAALALASDTLTMCTDLTQAIVELAERGTTPDSPQRKRVLDAVRSVRARADEAIKLLDVLTSEPER